MKPRRYWPYGATRSGNIGTAYRFTGQRQDVAGLYFYQSRWYDAQLGRFVQPDPLVPRPGDPQSLNRYAYVRNNPLRYTDPTGHADTSVIPPGWFDWSKVQIDISNWSAMAKSLAVAGCFIAGCYVDRERDIVRGPTQEEALASGVLGLANPIGMVQMPAENALQKGIEKVLQRAWKRADVEAMMTLREEYETAVRALAGKADAMRAAGQSVEEIARAVYAERRAIGVKYKGMTPAELRDVISERNLQLYGTFDVK